MKILRPKRLLNRQELRRYMMERLRINPQAVPNLSRKQRRVASRQTLRQVRKSNSAKIYVVESPCNWLELLKENWLPVWGLKLWPVRYTEQ